MHLLYAVEFDVESGSDTEAFATSQELIASWLSDASLVSVSSSDLNASGAAKLPAADVVGRTITDRTASWDVLRAGDARALRVSVDQPLPSGVELTTRVTLSDIEGRVRLRVGLSRDFLGGALAPVRETRVFQPSLVRNAAHADELRLIVGTQVVDPRFQPVRGTDEVATLIAAIRIPTRLPLLLVHVRSTEARDAAYVAAQKLIGLARVVTVGNAERMVLSREIPSLTIPFGGAKLVWSDVEAPGITLRAQDIAAGGREHFPTVLMPRLAPVAALVRGVDEGWRQVRRSVEASARAEASERVRLASLAADAGEERDALRAKVALLESSLEAAEDLMNTAADEADGLRDAAGEAETLSGQVAYWRDLYHATFSPEGEADSDSEDPWAHIPVLKARASPSETFLALVDASDSRIAFTDAAERSWKKIDYPDPNDMTAALTALARGAQKLYSGDPGPISTLDEWFMLNFSLKVATTDKTIEDDKNLRYFTFEDKKWDQVRHVKVRDGVKPNEVGRIHFARDSSGKRLIVNHVALKLYGI